MNEFTTVQMNEKWIDFKIIIWLMPNKRNYQFIVNYCDSCLVTNIANMQKQTVLLF